MFSHLKKKHHQISLNITQFEKKTWTNRLSSFPNAYLFLERDSFQLNGTQPVCFLPEKTRVKPKAPRTCPWTLPWSVPPSNCRPSPSNPPCGIPNLRIAAFFVVVVSFQVGGAWFYTQKTCWNWEGQFLWTPNILHGCREIPSKTYIMHQVWIGTWVIFNDPRSS